jgi:hypothetical protein
MTNPEHLAEPDTAELKEIRTDCPELDAAARHVRDFANMMRDHRRDLLPTWMDRILADDLPALHSLSAACAATSTPSPQPFPPPGPQARSRAT